MTPKLVTGLALAAAVSLAAAGWAYTANHQWTAVAFSGERMLPRLLDEANQVAGVSLAQGPQTLTLQRDGAIWRIAERGGYPAKAERVGALIVALAKLTRLEAKTKDPGRLGLLELEDPRKEGAKSTLVTLKDAGGKELGSLVLGKKKFGATGPGQNGTYVRLPAEPQSWLAGGEAEAAIRAKEWVDPGILDLDTKAVARAVIKHPDGTILDMVREGADAEGLPNFKPAGAPADAKFKSDTTLRFAATDFAQFELDDVRKAKEGGEPVSEVELATDKGLKLALTLRREPEDKNWLSVRVIDKGEDAASAEAIAKKVEGWQFLLPAFKARAFEKRLQDLLQTS